MGYDYRYQIDFKGLKEGTNQMNFSYLIFVWMCSKRFAKFDSI